MRVLAFDTASTQLALAAGTVDGCSVTLDASFDAEAPRKANQVLLERAGKVLEDAGYGVSELDAIVVGRGPGSFTGVRIGVATAKGLACGLGVPLHGVSTLDAVAWRVWRAGVRGEVGIVADAMRKEVYPVRFALTDAGVERLEVDTVAKPADTARAWAEAGRPLTLFGDGLKKHAACFDDALFTLGDEALWLPDGEGLLQAYVADIAAGRQDSGNPAELLPVYTRLSDAEENERKRLRLSAEELPKSGVAEQRAVGGLFLHPMSINDVDAVAKLQQRALPLDAWTSGKLADEIGRDDRSWWVARKDGDVIGCAGGQVVDGELCIFIICVDPAERAQGVGTRLIERVATDGRALGAETVTLEVRTDNDTAITFYHGLGLEDVGVRPRYYKGKDDALIMRGTLPLHISSRESGGSMRISSPDSPASAVADAHKMNISG